MREQHRAGENKSVDRPSSVKCVRGRLYSLTPTLLTDLTLNSYVTNSDKLPTTTELTGLSTVSVDQTFADTSLYATS